MKNPLGKLSLSINERFSTIEGFTIEGFQCSCFADLFALFLFEQLMQAHTLRMSISLRVECLEPNYRGERNVDTQYFFQLTTPILHMK